MKQMKQTKQMKQMILFLVIEILLKNDTIFYNNE